MKKFLGNRGNNSDAYKNKRIMKPPCEIVVKLILPALRSVMVKELVEKYGMTQMDVADKLGITQAAVSFYLSEKRGRKNGFVDVFSLINDTARKLAEDLVKSEITTLDIVKRVCYFCIELRSKNLICEAHLHLLSLPEEKYCDLCAEIPI